MLSTETKFIYLTKDIAGYIEDKLSIPIETLTLERLTEEFNSSDIWTIRHLTELASRTIQAKSIGLTSAFCSDSYAVPEDSELDYTVNMVNLKVTCTTTGLLIMYEDESQSKPLLELILLAQSRVHSIPNILKGPIFEKFSKA